MFDYAKPGTTPRALVAYLPVGDQYLHGDDLLFALDVYGPVAESDPYEGAYYLGDIKIEALDIP